MNWMTTDFVAGCFLTALGSWFIGTQKPLWMPLWFNNLLVASIISIIAWARHRYDRRKRNG